MVRLIVAVFVALFAATYSADLPFNETYPFSLTLVDDSYYLYWNFSRTEETIQFAVRVKTEGWVGFGISPNGQMPGSDVVIGWVDGDRAYFHDRYADQRSTPAIDNMQDWFLISAAINNGYTELEFSRNFTTCDNEGKDLDILPDTSRIVYSWNDQKPTVITVGTVVTYNIVRHSFKGSASVNLLGGQPVAPTIPANAEQFTVGVSNIVIPAVDTTYWCRGIAMESLVGNTSDTRYIIKFGPSITEGAKEHVHHVLVYTCDTLTNDDLGPGGNCNTQVSDRIGNCRGGDGVLIAAWAIGGIDFIYPEDVAYPFGGEGEHQYFVIEMHYNNPSSLSGVVDNSGLVFTYLEEKTRTHDAGILFFGHHVSFRMVIPPNAENYSVSAWCPADCNAKYIPTGGIKIFANMLHTHLAGHGVSFSLLRKNATNHYEEIRPIDKNLKYDFNFQQVTSLQEEVTVLPGDDLLLRCFYNTKDRDTTTFGGDSTQEEMCLSFPIYYPKIEMLSCKSHPEFDEIIDFVLNEIPPEQQANFAVLQQTFAPTTIGNALNPVNWTDERLEALENAVYVKGNQFAFCSSSDSDLDVLTDAVTVAVTGTIPTISKYYSSPAPVRNCTVVTTPDGANPMHMSVMVVLIFTALSLYLLFC